MAVTHTTLVNNPVKDPYRLPAGYPSISVQWKDEVYFSAYYAEGIPQKIAAKEAKAILLGFLEKIIE